MADLDVELKNLVKGEKDSQELYEWLDDDLHNWDFWYSDLFTQTEASAARALKTEPFGEDASLHRDWLKPLRADVRVVNDEREARPGLWDSVEELVKIYFDEGFAPPGAAFEDAVRTVFWRAVSWRDWLRADIEWTNETYKDYDWDLSFGPDEDQKNLGL